MQQAKHVHSPQQIRRFHVEHSLESVVVVEAFVDYACVNDGIDQEVIPSNFKVGCKNYCDAMANGEDGHTIGHILERG